MIGGYDVNMATVRSVGVTLTLFQKNAMVSPLQARTAERLFAFNYEDAEEALALAREVHARHPIDAVVSFTEMGLETAGLIRDRLGIAGNPLFPVAVTRDKVQMRKLLAERDIPSARYCECHSKADLVTFWKTLRAPLVLKPSKGCGSAGVSFASTEAELDIAWECSASLNLFPLIAEEYFDGPEISVETLTKDGVHEVIAITEKRTTGRPHFVETGHQQPARMPDAERRAIEKVVTAFLSTIEHRLGPAHTELRLTPVGPRLIESQTRPGGGFIWQMVLLGIGVDLVKETLAHLAGAPPPVREAGAGAAAIRFFAHSGKTVARIEGLDEAAKMPGVVHVDCSATPGDVLGPLLSSDDRQGFVLATGSTTDLACENVERAFAQVTFHFAE